MQMGHDPEVEMCEPQFTTQNIIELEVAQIKDLTGQGIMSLAESRDWLRTNTGMELPDDKEVAQMQQDKTDLAKQSADNKGFDKKKPEKKKEQFKTLRQCKMCKEGQHAFCSKRGCQCQ
jgi:hypothetical protein